MSVRISHRIFQWGSLLKVAGSVWKENKKAGKYPAFLFWCGGMDSNHHEIAPASPSSWCVYQFRHHRISIHFAEVETNYLALPGSNVNR